MNIILTRYRLLHEPYCCRRKPHPIRPRHGSSTRRRPKHHIPPRRNKQRLRQPRHGPSRRCFWQLSLASRLPVIRHEHGTSQPRRWAISILTNPEHRPLQPHPRHKLRIRILGTGRIQRTKTRCSAPSIRPARGC